MGHDVIHMRGLEFYGYHGVLPEEKVLGQRFSIDVDLFLDLGPAGRSDDMRRTINYANVYKLIKECVEQERFHLLEGLAEALAARILERLPCTEVRVEVHKPEAPIPGVFRDISVEITRGRER